MKRILLLVSFGLTSVALFAGSLNNTIKIYSGGQFINYQEDIASQESGALPNFGIYGEHNFSKYSKITGEFDYQSGSLTYNGTTQDGNTVCINSANHSFYTGFVTYQVNISPMFSIPFLTYAYMGVGESLWLRATDAQSRMGDYQENYRYMYLPIGMDVTIPVNEKLTLIPQVEVDYIFNGTMTAFLSKFGSPFVDNTVQLGSSYGYKLSIEGDYAFNERLMLFAKPYYQFIKLNQSNYVNFGGGYFREPSSGTNIWGVQAGIGINF
ncbi:MAG: hypothetical protein NTX05_01300 [Fusobacteria bacterium]|nr:hypothetical protein [Fusobacteriota bacterium]